MGATPCSLFPTSLSNDNSVGDGVWTNPSNGTSSDGDMASSTTTGFVTVALPAANPTSQRLKALFESKVIGEDADGTWSIPDSATIVGIEDIVEWHQNGTTGTVTELEAKILKAGTVTGDDQGSSATLFNSSHTAYQAQYTTYGGQASLWGTTFDPATDLGASSGFGLALRLTGDGANDVNACLDTIFRKVFFTTASLSVTIRDNSGESTRQAPWVYHAHCQASSWKSYNPQDCKVVWEMIQFPDGWNPGGHTDPITGEEFRLTRMEGFNAAWPCDVAGTYKVRCTIYAPDMSESDDAEATFTVSADSRTHRYYDPDATGANDGTSAADAWTSAASVVTDANANPSNRWYHLAAGKVFKPAGGQQTFTSLSNVVISSDTAGSTATVQRTTDSGNAMWVFAAATNLVLKDLDFDGQATSNLTWGFTFGGASANVSTINCTGQRCRSWNENTDDATVRRKILHWKPVVIDVYRYGFYISSTATDIIVVAPSFTALGTNGGEGMIRLIGSSSDARKSARCNILWPSFPGAASPTQSQAAIRDWYCWSHVYHGKSVNHSQWVFGQNSNSYTLFASHTKRWDGIINISRTAWTSSLMSLGLGSITDATAANVGLDTTSATNSSGGIGHSAGAGVRRIKFLHPWIKVHSNSGGGNSIIISDSAAIVGAATGVEVHNGLHVTRDPSQTQTSRFIEHRTNDNGLAAASGNVYSIENGGTTTRTNWRRNNTDYTLANWNALGEVSDEIQVRLPTTAIDANDMFSLADKSASGTVASGTSTTVFTGDSGLSSEDHYYNGWTIVVGANSAKTVQSYVGSTRTFTLTSALSGTPASPDAITLTRDFSTERANGKIAYAAGAQADIFGRFRDFGETNCVPGPNGLITLPTMSTVTATVGDETVVLSWTAVSGATKYRVWINYGSVSDPAWYLYGETAGLSLAVGSLANDTEVALGVSVVDGSLNESSIFQIDATPLRGTTGNRIYVINGDSTGSGVTNAANVNGEADGSVATMTETSTSNSGQLGGALDTATLTGTPIAWKMGARLRYNTDLAAGAYVGFTVNEGGAAAADGVATITPGSSLADVETYLRYDEGVGSLAAFTALVENGDLDGAEVLGAINGPSIWISSPAGATTIEVDAIWLEPVYAGTSEGGGSGISTAKRILLLRR